MPTLLIVDDEMPQVRALGAIIRRMKPDYDIVACTDGEEAWRTIKDRSVDALITDIRMPGMDGMELIQQVHLAYPRLNTVLLSGYGQFEYAQEAIRCNVLEYVIKPIGQEAITRILEKLEARWEEDKQRSASEALYAESMWQRLLEGRLDKEHREELRRSIGRDGPGLSLALDLPERDARRTGSELERRLKALGNVRVIPPSAGESRWIVLLWLSSYYTVRMSEGWAKMQEMLDHTDERTGRRSAAGASGIYPLLFDKCDQACREALTAASRSFYEPHSALLRYRPQSAYADSEKRQAPFPIARLAEAVRAGERRRLSEELHVWLTNEMRTDPQPTPEHFKVNSLNGLLQVLNRLDDPLQAGDRHRLAEEAGRQVAEAKDWMELRSRMSEWLERVADGMRQLTDDPQGTIVKRCQDYIKRHYKEDLSLERVSAMFNFNPSYFSNYFRTKTGTRFSDYLLGVRIDKAKEMLLTSSRRVEEIALEVGFSHSAYFIRMFKRETGVSPAAFRRLTGIR